MSESRHPSSLFVSDWHPSIFFLVYRALPNLQIIPSAKPSITANHKSYSKPKWNSNCSFFEATLLELIIQNIYMLKSPDSSHANLSWLDVIGTGLNFQWFFLRKWKCKCEIELSHQSKLSKLLCWLLKSVITGIIWQIMQGVVEWAKSHFIQAECLCVFSRL